MNRRMFPACPVCGNNLRQSGKSLRCEAGHCFDFAKEGYVNLLTAQHKKGDAIGDNRAMAAARHRFLEKGYFSALADAVALQMQRLTADDPTVLDICCGEGYYAEAVAAAKPCRLFGFDLSKEMVRLAAKRKLENALFFVGNLAAIPLPDASVDFAMHLFAPFHATEFSRVLKPGGTLLSVIPGKTHLYALKEAIYDTPYFNDEKAPTAETLRLTARIPVQTTITLSNPDDIRALFSMTPYAYRTAKKDLEKLNALQTLTTEISFVLLQYEK